MLGTFIGPYLLDTTGYYGTYSMRLGIQVFVVLYYAFVIKNEKLLKVHIYGNRLGKCSTVF